MNKEISHHYCKDEHLECVSVNIRMLGYMRIMKCVRVAQYQ